MKTAFLFLLPYLCFANPVGEKIVFGDCEVSRFFSATTIHQTSKTAVIEWTDFSIEEGEFTRFIQPSVEAVALNRVVTGQLSRIFGSLESNGQIYLINSNGVMMGASGVVKAGGFLASTLNLSDEAFLSGEAIHFADVSGAKIIHEGSIEAKGVYLFAKEIENRGSIEAEDLCLCEGTEVYAKPFDSQWAIRMKGVASAQAQLLTAGENIESLAVNCGSIEHARGAEMKEGKVILR